MILCALIADYSGYFEKIAPVIIFEEEAELFEDEDFSTLFAPSENIPDSVLEYYRNYEYKEWVIEFFTAICSNREIAWSILDCSDEFDIPPALAFALCWEESRFNPNAVNRQNRNGSVDRGLFQLNNRSFPHLDISSFYSINSNARYGIGHLRYCLNSGGSEISALAMYNAGTGRVRSTGAPEVTLNYTSRILENRRKIESRFHSRLIKEEEKRLTENLVENFTESTSGGLFNRVF
jgi:soluble lytic murein transglycosylase-like protein